MDSIMIHNYRADLPSFLDHVGRQDATNPGAGCRLWQRIVAARAEIDVARRSVARLRPVTSQRRARRGQRPSVVAGGRRRAASLGGVGRRRLDQRH